MVFSYGYCWWQNQQWRTNAPCLPAVSMATAVRRRDTDGIAQCDMFRTTPEATGCRHWATTCSVLPQCPPGQQANKQQSTNTPTYAGRFNGHCNAAVQYRVHRLMEEVQGFTRSHWMPLSASTCSDSNESDIAIPWVCYLLWVSGDGDGAIDLDG